MTMSKYLLANHAFLCRAGRHYVFLDLKADRYWAIAREHLEALGPSLRGWPESGQAPALPEDEEAGNACHLGDVFVRRGLLTTDPAAGRDVASTRFPLPERGLPQKGQPMIRQPGPWHVSNFIIASCSATAKRRWRPISKIIGKPARHSRSKPNGFDEDRCRDLVAVFSALRPYFPEKSSCLLDSFMLIEFLARYEIRPHWVFGVRTAPFSAHCWVQHEDLVLNDTPDHVGSFAPIMVI
jgi:hypothetical protein